MTQPTNLPTFSVSATSETENQTTVETRGFEFTIDKKKSFGGDDEGPNPLEFILGSWAGCLNIVCHIVADEKDLNLTHLEFEIEGDIDTDRFLGNADDVRAGYQNLRVNITTDIDADNEVIEEWLTEVEQRCPISDNIANTTPTNLSVATR